VLGSRGYKLLALAETVGSTNQLRKFDPHLVVLDLNMPAIEGEKLLDIFRQSLKKMPKVIFYSGMNPDDLREIAEQRMADDYVYKGDGLFRLLSCVNYHLYEMGLI
jgi:CheY-like chemotaxis protein